MKKNIIRKYLIEKRPKCIQINDLVSLICGVKDVVYTQIYNSEDEKLLHELSTVFKFTIIPLGEKIKNIAKYNTMDVLIGNNIKKMNKAKILYNQSEYISWGFYLGYPQCCVEKYLYWHNTYDSKLKYKSLIEYTFKNTKKVKIIPFYINNVINFYSRLRLKKLKNKMNHYLQINKSFIKKGLDLESFIIWHPCSYNCKESIKKAKEIANFMKEYIPEIYYIRKKLNSKPVLFKDDFDFVFLNGETKIINQKIVVNYNGVYPFPKTFTKKSDIKVTNKYKTIETKNKKIIYPDLLKNFLLLPFGE
ncbi:MAG: hypothetical protein N2Z20_05105 [Elusimicrobiales bacterium]|nr:hypothetical protein [Elusimicrobiales bacterium]